MRRMILLIADEPSPHARWHFGVKRRP